MFRFEHNVTFLEVSRNVEIWRHFGTPFVLVLSREPHENGKELWRLRPVWGVLETFLQFSNWSSSLKIKHARKMCFTWMQQHWRRPKERDIREACMHEIKTENVFKEALLVMCSFSLRDINSYLIGTSTLRKNKNKEKPVTVKFRK